jgi:hypothetical protein
MQRSRLVGVLFASALAVPAARATTDLIAIGSLNPAADLSGLSGLMENGAPGDSFGGMGSGLAWAGGSTFLALPDRGPNAVAWAGGTPVDNTTTYVSRFHTLTLALTPAPSGGLPFALTPTLTGTTLLFSPAPLSYGAVAPAGNVPGRFYFSGRSDNFGAGDSLSDTHGRFDPEGVRVSNDGKYVYVSDEYGPYVYRFDRATGERLSTYVLPAYFAISNLSGVGATEINPANNPIGRVANKGMEGLAITPDGSMLVGFVQSPLIQDGGDGGRANRIVTIDVASGVTHQYVYDNFLADTAKAYNSSEILALNDHEFLVLERDGKGKGDGSNAVVKRIYKIDLAGATDVGALNGGAGISGEANLLPFAVGKQLFLDLKVTLGAHGIVAADVPAKLEGMAFGPDVVIGGTTQHTLYVANDNDFLPDVAGPNNVYVFAFTDADLGGSVFQNQAVTAWAPLGAGLPGVNGVPVLAGTGSFEVGSAGSLSLTSAKPSAAALLFVSLTGTPAPFKGGVLVANPVDVAVPLGTDANGEIALPFSWPAGVPSATAFYVQYAVQDAAAVQGVALSNGLKGVAP